MTETTAIDTDVTAGESELGKLDLSKYGMVEELLKNRPTDICAGGTEECGLSVSQSFANQLAFFNMLPLKDEQRAKLWATISEQPLPPRSWRLYPK